MSNSDQLPWIEPCKKIFDGSDLVRFKRSIAYQNLHRTLWNIIDKIKGNDVPSGVLNTSLVTREKANVTSSMSSHFQTPSRTINGDRDNDEYGERPFNFQGVLRILHRLNVFVDETPPLEGPRRFGNLACRDWHDKIIVNIEQLLTENLSPPKDLEFEGFIKEIKFYFLNSFGSNIRLDYGTGHELSFLAFLGSLIDFNFISLKELSGADLLIIFSRYYDLTRRLILEYNLEPAGSHGVWGLDDHFHLIYIFGAAQFNSNKVAPPIQQVLSNQVINAYKGTNLYVNAVSFIYKIKSGPFNEHSPIIYDIHSSVLLWSKVLTGLLKMFEVEVLNKFPVVQHFWFGNVLYPWRDFETNEELPIYQKEERIEEEGGETGFLNGNNGIKTTQTNISMTGAPWAMNPSTRTRQPPQAIRWGVSRRTTKRN